MCRYNKKYTLKIIQTFNSYYLEMFDIPFALAYLNKSSREVLLSKLETKKRLKRLEQFVQQRKSNLNIDELTDDDWDMQNYIEALNKYDKGESEYKGFDLRKIHGIIKRDLEKAGR